MTDRYLFRAMLVAGILMLGGCSDWTTSHPAKAYLPSPGQYAPPDQPMGRLTVAVPAVAVDNPSGLALDVDAQAAAADELFTLLDSSGRFDLTERMHMHQVLERQKLAAIIEPGRLVRPAGVVGFDYVMLGRIKDLSVKREPPPDGVSVVGVESALHLGQGWVPKIIVHAKVELMLVDVHTGAAAVAGNGEFKFTGSPHDLGLQLTADQLLATPQVQLNPFDTHRVLRLALDDTLRPLLPRVDRWVEALPLDRQAPNSAPPSQNPLANAPPANPLTPPPTPTPATKPATGVLADTMICPECGARVNKSQEFCPVCGHKLH